MCQENPHRSIWLLLSSTSTISQKWHEKIMRSPIMFPTIWSESEGCLAMSNSLWPPALYSPWNSPGQNTGVGSLFLLQQIFPTQELNWGLLHCRWILCQLSYQWILEQNASGRRKGKDHFEMLQRLLFFSTRSVPRRSCFPRAWPTWGKGSTNSRPL